MKFVIDKVYRFYRLRRWTENSMSYSDTNRASRQQLRNSAKAAVSAPAPASALTYLVFTLSVGFMIAVVFGVLA